MRLFNTVFGICFAILSQAGLRHALNECSWETSTSSKKYNFDLLTSSGHRYGARSENGFYSVSVKESSGYESTYWFQLCEHMKFNYNPPRCDHCESCGGPYHCGETCSALQSTSDGGYSHCTTLGTPSNNSFSLIDSENPDKGVAVKMLATGAQNTCSFSVSIYCPLNKEELPTFVTKSGTCDYMTSFYHSAGCPIVTNLSRGGMGWFATFIIVLLCLLVLYLAVGIAYRVTVLGVTGLEVIPNLDFWKALPHTIQIFVEACVSYIRNLYRQFSEPSYSRVSG